MQGKKLLINKLMVLNKCRWCFFGEIKKGKPKCKAPDEHKDTCSIYKLREELYGPVK